MTAVIGGGPTLSVVSSNLTPVGAEAIPVYLYTSGHVPAGGPATPVRFVTDAQLIQNGGQYRLSGQPYATPIVAVSGVAVAGGPVLAVYDVTNKVWPQAQAVSGSNGDNFMQATVTLTGAQIKALPTGTPITIVAAPGTNKVIMVLGALFECDTANNGYGNIATDGFLSLTLKGLHDVSVASVFNATAGQTQLRDLLTSFDNTGIFVPPTLTTSTSSGNTAEGVLFSVGDAVDAPLKLTCFNGSSPALGDYTGGDAANSMQVTVIYLVLDV